MIRQPPRSTHTVTLLPYPTLFPSNPAIHACTGVPMSLANCRRPRASILGFALAAAIGGSFTPGLVFADTGSAAAQVTIPYQEFTLPNGLTVIVHEDHKAPIVAVNIWYGVGSKNEPAGRSGF